MKFTLPQNLKIVELLTPASDAGGRTGDYVSLKNANHVWIVAHIAQGNAATVALTPTQASAVAGTGAKALSQNAEIWANLDCAASDDLARTTAAKNYTTDAGVKHKIVVFDINPRDLDLANGFDCLTVVSGASHADNIVAALAFLEMRYPGDDLPEVITD